MARFNPLKYGNQAHHMRVYFKNKDGSYTLLTVKAVEVDDFSYTTHVEVEAPAEIVKFVDAPSAQKKLAEAMQINTPIKGEN
jgi:hypothetical protein